ncbi:glycoside hydrolase family 3 C-terminal domain-containing protein [Thermobifida halotolerans]|uniref:Glycoside hydrolase family 3 C-terminal domain-containing protein n=1 Tax=Thermobifida halotolerans TaxID=483545 RepID=A0AA97LZZ8_9ACTN|nr:glycoside hydrolase family 3 C-terminal domain-containing protein [Thermobifida halotolerans]UOE21168.1 glycoside hydrolase family 3 C-terminal domain-containing protein [Thermobifida halotolerans]
MERRAFLTAAALSALAASVPLRPSAALADSPPWTDTALSAAERADALLAAMTPDQKTALICCDFDAVADLGVPRPAFADASAGVRGETGVTAFPVPLAQAATFSPDLLRQLGSAIAAEVRGKAFNSVLGPTVDLARTWRAGRAAEGMGEDPLLAGVLGAEVALGMREQHVTTTVKHFSAYTQEADRTTVDVRISARGLHETYHAPFRTIVEVLPDTSVMTSYPRINGVYAPQNPDLIDDLKGDIGLEGYVVPDFMSGDDQIAAARAGVDLAGLGPDAVWISPSVLAGSVPADRIDDAVRRILVTMFAGGLFDHPVPEAPQAVVSTAEHRQLAHDLAVHGTVLLANDGVLPLAASVGGIAVIGPADEAAVTGIEGSTWVEPGEWTTPLQAIRDRAGSGTSVTHAQGTRGDVALDPVPGDALTDPDGAPGLRGTYYAGPDLSGSPVATRTSATLDFDSAPVSGLPAVWSARWTGTLTPPATGLCRFSLLFTGRAKLVVDGRTVAEGVRPSQDFMFGPHTYPLQGTVELTEGRGVDVTVEYTNEGSFLGAVGLHLGWQPVSVIDGAVEAARDADVAVVMVNRVAGENMDHTSLALPGDQDALISAVAAVNSSTVVVLNTDGPVLMPWLDDVAAVVQTWYGGRGMGTALASVLFGDADPAGRLPVTFPADESQGPGSTPQTYPGVDGRVDHSEGSDIGYRFYQRNGQQPLFCFGHGLSYTTFALDGLGVRHDQEAGELVAEVNVRNTGARAGHEVVQLYVGLPESADAAPKQLKAFRKVRLDPGELRRVELRVALDELRVWDETAGRWRFVDGLYQVHAGRSSTDTPLHRTIHLNR